MERSDHNVLQGTFCFQLSTVFQFYWYIPFTELESSRTHFEVLEGQPRKLTCPRLEDSTIFWIVKILWSAWKIIWKTFFCGDRLKNFCEDLFSLKSTCACVLGLGLEHSCPWPRECLSSERLSLALASDFFCALGLKPCVLDSTSDYYHWNCRKLIVRLEHSISLLYSEEELLNSLNKTDIATFVIQLYSIFSKTQ